MTTETESAPRRSPPSLKFVARLIARYHQPLQSDFQNDHFVLAQVGVTTYGAFMQALREIATRIESMREQYIRLNELRCDTTEAEIKSHRAGEIKGNEDIKRRTHKRRMHFDLAKTVLAKASLELAMKDREREFANLVNRAIALEMKLEEESGPLTDEKIADLEREMWRERMLRRAYAEKACHGSISSGTLEALLAMPPADCNDIIERVMQPPVGCLESLRSLPVVDVSSLVPPPERTLLPHEVHELLAGTAGDAQIEGSGKLRLATAEEAAAAEAAESDKE